MEAPLFLANLQKRREPRPIIVKVLRKWTTFENQGEGEPLYVGLVLADVQGDSLYAEIAGEAIPLKAHLFDVGAVYQIKKFTVRNAKENFRVLDRPIMIEISKYSTIDALEDPPRNITNYGYSLMNFSQVVPVDGPLPQYIDVVGYLTKYSGLETFVPKSKEKVVILRELYIRDLQQNEMKVTIWGDYAVNFDIDHVYDEKAGNVVVCLIVGCAPRRNFRDYDKAFLSGSSPFAYYLNPRIPEAQEYYARFRNTPVFIDRPPKTNVPTLPPIEPKQLHLRPLAELNAIEDPYDFEDGKYKCAVTITSIVHTGKWWYMACKPCKKKAVQQPNGSYHCPQCNGSRTISRYLLTFMARDDTDEARFFAHDTEAKIIIGRECEAIMSPLALNGGFPQQILNIVDKKYVFSIDLDDGPNRQYIVKAVLAKPSRRPAQAPAETSQNSPGGSVAHGITMKEVGSSSGSGQIAPVQAQPLQIEAMSLSLTPTTSVAALDFTPTSQMVAGSILDHQIVDTRHQMLQAQTATQSALASTATGVSKVAAISDLEGRANNTRRSLTFEEDAETDKEIHTALDDSHDETAAHDDVPLTETPAVQNSKRRRTSSGKEATKQKSNK